GHWIHDLSRFRNAVIMILLIWARIWGTRTGVFCIGAGPLNSRWSKTLVRFAFTWKSLIVTRDENSREMFEILGFRSPILGADLALEMKAEHVRFDLDPCRPRVGIAPCAWFKLENIYKRDCGTEEN